MSFGYFYARPSAPTAMHHLSQSRVLPHHRPTHFLDLLSLPRVGGTAVDESTNDMALMSVDQACRFAFNRTALPSSVYKQTIRKQCVPVPPLVSSSPAARTHSLPHSFSPRRMPRRRLRRPGLRRRLRRPRPTSYPSSSSKRFGFCAAPAE